MRTRLRCGRHFDERQFAAHRGQAPYIIDLDHILQLVKRGHDAMPGSGRSIAHHGHARNVRPLRATYGDRRDIDIQPPEQGRHPGQYTRFVFYVGNKGVLHGHLSTSGFFDGRRIISCSAAPGTIIGYTVSSGSTRKLIRKGPLRPRAAATASFTSARVATDTAGMHKAWASFTKSGEKIGEHS